MSGQGDRHHCPQCNQPQNTVRMMTIYKSFDDLVEAMKNAASKENQAMRDKGFTSWSDNKHAPKSDTLTARQRRDLAAAERKAARKSVHSHR